MSYTYNEIRGTDQFGGSWWEHILLKPFTYKLTFLFANYTKFTPNQITMMSLIFGLMSAYSFLKGTWYYLIIGAILFECSFILDYTDGRIARLKGLKSIFGAYLDIISDFTKYFFIILCLAYGQYLVTNDVSFLLYGYVFMFAESAFIANSYIIRFHQPEFGMNKKDVHQMRRGILNDKLPFIIKLKTRLDPDNKLSYIPNDVENIAFFVAPIIVKIKLGFVFGSILLFVNILSLIIFNFVMKKD